MLLGLMAELPRVNCWTLAEHAGHATPHALQHLLSRARRDAARLDALQLDRPPMDDRDAYDRWVIQVHDVLSEHARTAGAVCLCHQGCASRNWLVVSGPDLGRSPRRRRRPRAGNHRQR